jgi:hypothetical protein
MGLLDSLENQALGTVLGGSANPLASSLLQMIRPVRVRIRRSHPTRFIRSSAAIR